MKSEIYPQYTSRWHKIDIRYRSLSIYNMIDWCEKHESNGKYHVFNVPSTDSTVTHVVEYPKELRFEFESDATMFALRWL